jgi:hypothetical protein
MIFLNESGEILEFNRISLDWTNPEGSYNLRNPKNNSDQDYEGNFYEPTEKITKSEDLRGYMDVNIATVNHGLQFNDDDNTYMTDFEYEPKKEMTIPEKHYKFIKENFDFLKN